MLLSLRLTMRTRPSKSSFLGRYLVEKGMTYSIVARDDATGELGVAVGACMFAAGSVVPWARAGVGAVATQALSEASYGPRCLELLADGASSSAART